MNKKKKFRSFKKIFLFLVILLLIDFFLVANIDPVCRQKQGHGFNYSLSEKEQNLIYSHYNWERVKYNFTHFFIFWQKPPLGKNFNNLFEFLSLDIPPSNIVFNILHFFAFLFFTLLLLYFFKLSPWLVFLIALFFNLFHEYVAEGICMDPSFNDLWVNLLGTFFGLLIWAIFRR